MIRDLIVKNRSTRRFYQNHIIELSTLEEFIDLARLSPSAANLQRLRFKLSNNSETNKKVFSTLSWAGYLKDWDGPKEGERPSAYILILTTEDDRKSVGCDAGIACQSILLGAVEKNLRGCIFGSVDRIQLRKNLLIPKKLKIVYVIALGKPKERVVIDSGKLNDLKYWRDKKGIHHVPKLALDDLIL